jgi:IMP dehydrogenase
MNLRKSKGLTFDDVLLVPKRSPIRSRSEVSTATFLTKSIALNLPIVSANMDTVTEFNMAIAMARAGGIGIIHRFMTVSQQVRQIERVKRAEGFIVSDPYRIDQKASLEDAERLMEDHGVGGLIVTDNQKKVIGIITRRDIFLAPDRQLSVKNVMTLPDQIISAQPGITLEEARQLLYEHRLEKLPIMDDQGNLVGLITAQDVVKSKRFPAATCDDQGRLRVGAAIGITKGEEDRAADLLAAGADVLVLDIAHGHADHCLDMVRILRERHPDAQIIAGNVATRDGARDLAEVGADAVKVGIGPGSICTTRIVTGFGVPQLTAVADAVAGIKESGRDIPVIADGGIRTSGDMVKALAAGASSVMIGSLFAGCEEAPGNPIIRDGKKVKVVRGMASLGAAISRQATTKEDDESAESQEDWDKVIPEGVEAVVPYRGYVREILHQLGGGLRSGLSYGGARTIAELQENAEFIEITPAGSHESGHHDVLKL